MPKPTALQILEGNPSHRPLPKGEPRPRAIIPIAPEHLDAVGHAFYDRLIQVMSPVSGWLTEADFAVAGECANWYSIYFECNAYLQQHGWNYYAIFVDGTGAETRLPKAWPQVKGRKDAWAECLKLLDRLGLSPGQRARMTLAKGPNAENDDIDP